MRFRAKVTVELWAGDVLLVYTDGVPEAHNPENEKFGEKRRSSCSVRLPTFQDAEQYDDLTFGVMKVR